MIFIVLLQALWASSIPMSKVLLSMTQPIFLAGIRMVIAGAVLLGYKYWYSYERFQLPVRHMWLFAQVIFFGIYLKYILRYWGLAHLPTAKLAFMLNITPFCVALLSYVLLHEVLSYKKWLGLGVGFSGIIPVLYTTSSAEQIVGELFCFSWPELAILAEIIAHSYALIVMRTIVCDNGYSSGMTNGIRMFGGGLLALMTALSIETITPIADPFMFVSWLALLIVISNIICHNLYIYLLKYYSATFLAFTDFLSPLFVAFYGWLFLHESITWHYSISALIIFVGLYLFYQEELHDVALFKWNPINMVMQIRQRLVMLLKSP